MKRNVAAALLLAVAVPGVGLAQEQTVQQQFDAAAAARDAANWPEALRLFEALEARTRNPRTLALVRLRRGGVLIELGRLDEAETAIRQGLSALPADDAALNFDRFFALLNLGRLSEQQLDYPEALRRYREAIAVPVEETDRLIARRGLIQTQMFTDAAAALAEADSALQAAASGTAGRGVMGQLRTLKGRVLLNMGRFQDARRELEEAQRLLGGLTDRVDRADLIARSDLAIAALLEGRREDARRYLAYTGAGRFERGYIGLQSWQLPQCGDEVGTADVAVIEAYVTPDGSVGGVVPIYASRPGPSALIFARAVGRWLFSAEGANALPALFRSVVRVEVRCSDSDVLDRYDWGADDAIRRLAAVDAAWSAALSRATGQSPTSLRQALTARAGALPPRDTLAFLLALADKAGVPAAERETLLRRALPIVGELGLPADVLAATAMAIGREQMRQRPPARRSDPPDYDGLLALPQIARSAEAMAYVRLAEARRHYAFGELDQAAAIAAAARSLPEARTPGPLATQALEVEMAVAAARGNPDAARAAHAAMGPRADRCGLPVYRTRVAASSADFPREAQRWGFEGWALSTVTVDSNGRVVQARTSAAYPPFVFGDASRAIAERSPHARNYSPDGAPCPGASANVTFRLPG